MNSSASPAAQPDSAVPAIGCPPTYRARGAYRSTASATATLTLTASVSRQAGAMASTRRSTSGTAGSGTASTTSASASAARRRAASVLIVTSNPSAQARAAVDSDALAPHTVRPAFSAARSSDPPINPAPTTQIARSATIGETTPFGGWTGRRCVRARRRL